MTAATAATRETVAAMPVAIGGGDAGGDFSAGDSFGGGFDGGFDGGGFDF